MQMTTEPSNSINSDISGAHEISLDELDSVNGGFLPLVIAAVFVAGYILGSENCAC